MQLTPAEAGPSAVCLIVSGRLDTPGVDEIEPRFTQAARGSGKHVLVDLHEVSFVSSMGVRMLISTARALHAAQRRMVLFAPQPLVREMLDTVALDQIIPVATDQTAALGLLEG